MSAWTKLVAVKNGALNAVACVGLAVALSWSLGIHAEQPTPSSLRTQKLEIVDFNGEVVAVFEGRPSGAHLTMKSPAAIEFLTDGKTSIMLSTDEDTTQPEGARGMVPSLGLQSADGSRVAIAAGIPPQGGTGIMIKTPTKKWASLLNK